VVKRAAKKLVFSVLEADFSAELHQYGRFSGALVTRFRRSQRNCFSRCLAAADLPAGSFVGASLR